MHNYLVGARLRLTAMTESDAATVARWQGDATFLRLLDAVPAAPRAEAQLAEWIKAANAAAPNGYLFGIRPLAGDDLLGYIELDGILWNQASSWVSIAIGAAEQRGQGFGSEALALALRFAFDELNLRRVQLTVFSYNTRAIATYERLGFTHEGTFREALLRDGQTHDMLLYGLLRREWEATHATPQR
jgi:RimJ/RimL family protein N-acetyltransferase